MSNHRRLTMTDHRGENGQSETSRFSFRELKLRKNEDFGFKRGLLLGSFPSSGVFSAAAAERMNGGAGFEGKWLFCGVKCGGRGRTRLRAVTSRGTVNYFNSSETFLKLYLK